MPAPGPSGRPSPEAYLQDGYSTGPTGPRGQAIRAATGAAAVAVRAAGAGVAAHQPGDCGARRVGAGVAAHQPGDCGARRVGAAGLCVVDASGTAYEPVTSGPP